MVVTDTGFNSGFFHVKTFDALDYLIHQPAFILFSGTVWITFGAFSVRPIIMNVVILLCKLHVWYVPKYSPQKYSSHFWRWNSRKSKIIFNDIQLLVRSSSAVVVTLSLPEKSKKIYIIVSFLFVSNVPKFCFNKSTNNTF